MHTVVRRGAIPLVLLGWILSISCGKAPDPGQKIVVGETVSLFSRHLQREMIVDLYLPDRYAEAAERYPLLLTCQSNGLHVAGIAADLASKNAAPGMIVASVRNYASDDLIPERIEGHPDSPGADRFLAFFSEELIPYLDSDYRTEPFRIFYSGSFGGAFGVYAMLSRPDVFNACLAATPAIDYEGGSTLISNRVDSWLENDAYDGRFLYMGAEDDPPLLAALEPFVDRLRRSNPAGLKWEYHEFPDEDHGSLPNRVIYHGLRFVFSDWNAIPGDVAEEGLAAIRVYTTGLEKTYGYDIGVSRLAIWRAAQSYRNQNRNADVIDLLRFSLEYHPDSEMVWLSLGRAYEEDGQLEQARTTLETAHRLAVENASPHVAIFVDALDKVTRKLAKDQP